jgi:hypothetical protein
MECIVCYKSINKYNEIVTECPTCIDGKLCEICMTCSQHNINGDYYLNCPLCRQLNWKHRFAEIISDMGHDHIDDLDKSKPVANIYYSNKLQFIKERKEQERIYRLCYNIIMDIIEKV